MSTDTPRYWISGKTIRQEANDENIIEILRTVNPDETIRIYEYRLNEEIGEHEPCLLAEETVQQVIEILTDGNS